MKPLVEHKSARHHYELLDQYEAGVELLGTEVKSIKTGQGKLEGAHVVIRNGSAYLMGANIPAYQPKNTPEGYDPERTRQLLLSKKQIGEIEGKSKERGLTIVPLSLYCKGPFVKISLALARGKKNYDKRHSIKKRDIERDIGRKLKGH